MSQYQSPIRLSTVRFLPNGCTAPTVCRDLRSGGGTRPASADGFTGQLDMTVCNYFGTPRLFCQSDSDSATKSFNPAHSFKTTLSVSVKFSGACGPDLACSKATVSGSAKFAISS